MHDWSETFYVHESEDSSLQEQLRDEFYHRVQRLVPASQQTLREKVFPHYLEVFEQVTRLPESVWWTWKEVQLDAAEVPVIENMRDAMAAWANEFSLAQDWIFDRTLQQMYDWRTDGCSALERALDPDAPREHLPPPFILALKGWNLISESQESAQRRLISEFERRLTVYFAERVKLAEAQGWVRRTKHRVASAEAHMDWLIEYQVERLSFRDITDRYDLGNDMVSHQTGLPNVGRSVRKMALRVGLKLRKAGVN